MLAFQDHTDSSSKYAINNSSYKQTFTRLQNGQVENEYTTTGFSDVYDFIFPWTASTSQFPAWNLASSILPCHPSSHGIFVEKKKTVRTTLDTWIPPWSLVWLHSLRVAKASRIVMSKKRRILVQLDLSLAWLTGEFVIASDKKLTNFPTLELINSVPSSFPALGLILPYCKAIPR